VKRVFVKWPQKWNGWFISTPGHLQEKNETLTKKFRNVIQIRLPPMIKLRPAADFIGQNQFPAGLNDDVRDFGLNLESVAR